ncbi:T9SS type A sorting domain-containing protein [Hymenobacter setariae]|uniref:T9SS type A sorting domain-containing protein n=1 Tax=Hymenobacter setariae TaxID=2594794 RepID=A0A558BYC3_9BACT|nr:T9SS type A sorting domain-containing protein [Hymenobacter setariae]TVT41518.1 T9SS type A sorting domain-containing protein [Hymenobacter setariae]
MSSVLKGYKIRVLFALLSSFFVQAAQAQTTLRFRLDSTYTTSAGAYRADGKLVRTLWQRTVYNPGEYQVNWDGLDNDGQPVGAGTYKIKVIAHNEKYVWEGVVGNTSASWTDNIWHSLTTMQDFCGAANGESYAALGYNEVTSGLVYSPTGTAQAPRRIFNTDLFDAFSFVRADDTYIYAATNNSGWDNLHSSFIMRFRQSDKGEAPWSSGQTAIYDLHKRVGVLSLKQAPVANLPQLDTWLANRITGFAVSSNYIAVARKAQNTVQFYATATGAPLGTLAVASPGQVAFASTGDLWVITAGQVKRFTVTGGKSFAEQNTLTGIVAPLALDAHPSQDLVLVADGGTSQQLKAYSAAGTPRWTYGQAGGYPVKGPDVVNDKFWFEIADPLARGAVDRDPYGAPFTFVKWQPDGTFWVLDAGNVRVLHFGADRSYREQIMFLPDRLHIAGDQADPTRMFSGHLEFKVSTSPLKPGDQSLLSSPTWKLVKNWAAGGVDHMRYSSLINVTTHANGRTYAQVHDSNTDNAGWRAARTQVVELPATGPLRFTGVLLEEFGNGGFAYDQMPDGSLRCARTNVDMPQSDYGVSSTGKAQLVCEERALTGYDSNFNPQYGPVKVMWTVLSSWWRGKDPFPSKPMGARIRIPRTENGSYVTYQASRKEPGAYHLGTVAPNAADWNARFHPGQVISRPEGRGAYPEVDAYGGWDGATVYADKKDIVALYNGQNNSVSNTFYHFSQDGLLISEFGVPATAAFFSDSNYSPPGLAGNNIDMYMIRPSANTLHVYTVDEAAHAGLHRWRVEGTNTLRELTGSGPLGSTIAVAQAGVVAAPLPVVLTTFEAARNAATVVCKWTTASEQNSNYFVVERSADGQAYSALGKVASGGTTTQVRNYSYLDAKPLPGTAYYRLRLVDKDGTESFSPVAVVTEAASATSAPLASVAPNPGTSLFELITPNSPLLEANIYTTLGKHICRLRPTTGQTQRIPFDLSTYPAGIYLVQVQMASGSTTVKVVKSN